MSKSIFSNKPSASATEKMYTCDWCGGVSPTADELLTHIRAQHVPQPPATVDRKDHQCSECERKYLQRRSLLRHVRECHQPKLQCEECGEFCQSQRTLRSHKLRKHTEVKVSTAVRGKKRELKRRGKKTPKFQCKKCKISFQNFISLYRHKVKVHPRALSERQFSCDGCWRRFFVRRVYMQHISGCPALKRKREGALRLTEKRLYGGKKSSTAQVKSEWESQIGVGGLARIHTLNCQQNFDVQLTLIMNKCHIEAMLQKDLSDLKRIKWYLVAHILVADGKEKTDSSENVRFLRSSPIITLTRGEIDKGIQEAILGVVNSFDIATGEGSKMLFERVLKLELRVAKYSPLKGSSYIPLPRWLEKKKALINIINDDEKCFLWSCLAGIRLHPSHPERVGKYKNRANELNMSGIPYPVKVTSISKFEEQNPNVAVSVFGLEKKNIVPIRVSRKLERRHHVRLLLLRQEPANDEGEENRPIEILSEEEEEELNSHYVLIKDMSRFLSHLGKQKRKLYWCDNCLTPRKCPRKHEEHIFDCIRHAPQKLKIPNKNNCIMKFTDFEKKLEHDYVIYADLESILVPLDTSLPNPEKSSTTQMRRHVPCGFCYVVVGPEGKPIKAPVLEHGTEGLIARFLRRLKEEEEEIKRLREQHNYPIHMTPKQEVFYELAMECYICGKNFSEENLVKVRDHNYRKETNNYRGAACMGCNLNLKRVSFIPVFFHGLSNYDSHCLLSEIGAMSDGGDMKCIPKTKEKYVSFSWGLLRFLDSFNFLSGSLDKLVQDLKPEQMKVLRMMFPDDELRSLVSRKGIYPYCYFDCDERFDETGIPPPEAFRNDMTGEDVSEEKYQLCLKIFKTFKMDSLWDYHDLYLLTDVLLLADVMQAYRSEMMLNFGLDVVHYYTTPGFAWSAAMLFTHQELELLTDLDMHLMFEDGLRGGVASINCRSADAKNPLVKEKVDPNSPSNEYLLYFDANNLYGTALSKPLPVGNFKFLTPSEIRDIDIAKIHEDDSIGYLFECDLKYADALHDEHNDYCLAPEHVMPQYSDLSPLQKRMIDMYNLPHCDNVKKLIPNLRDKYRYVVYGTTLKLYLELGLTLSGIHRVISFEQKAWLQPYIDHNTSKRQQATSEFAKNLWKLLNNSVFGKTVESLRRRKNVQFTSDGAKFVKLVKSPLFHSFELFDHGLAAVERKKGTIYLNRPVYTGQVVLDVSKEIMYAFHYKCMKAKYGKNITVLGTDTDSLIYKIVTPNVYEDMRGMSDWLDTSDYPPDHVLYSARNKKVLGKFKDEMNGTPIVGFRGLRAKMYSFRKLGDEEKCVGKGIPRMALKQQISFEDYDECLKNFTVKRVHFSKIGTDKKHHLFTTFSSKQGLCCFDNKRYILSDNVNTLAYGHYKLRRENAVPDESSDGDDELDEGALALNELIMLLDSSD